MNDKSVTEQVMSNPELHEQLSAFMDGELDADRARFLQQRLSHDVDLRACWERWQLASSSLRRQAQPLPTGFAERVTSALLVETAAQHPAHGHRALRWAGGAALAASLAVAGVFVFDATHQQAVDLAPQIAATARASVPLMQIERTVLPLPQPVIKLPIPVQSGVVATFHSPLRPVLLRQQLHRPDFSPFPQPYPIDPELEAYLQSQKSGTVQHDVFTNNVIPLPDANSSDIRTVSFPQGQQ